MANAHQTLRAHLEASGWIFALDQVEHWREKNPNGTVDEFIEDCRQVANKIMTRLVEVEMENGSTREAAERMVRQMRRTG